MQQTAFSFHGTLHAGFHFAVIDTITKYGRQLTDHIPGPLCVPVLGCVGEATTLTPKKLLAKSFEAYNLYGDTIKGWVLDRLFIFTSNAELIEQFLVHSTQTRKSNLYNILKPWLGTGLLISDSQKWYTRRKIITPTFHFTILEQFLEIFDRQSTVLINCLSERANGVTKFDIMPYICSATLDIIMESAMGVNVHAQTDKTMPYKIAVREITNLMMWRFIRAHLNKELVFSILCPLKKLRQNKLIKIMHKFTKTVIEERRRELEIQLNSEAEKNHDPHDIGARKHMALLDVLLQASIDGRPLSNDDIQEEVDTFMFEGHDTTTTAISFTLYLVSRHSEVQKRLLSEIYAVFGELNIEPFTMSKLNELKYMECVIKESMRLYPPVPLIGREISEDFHYTHSRFGDGIIPANTQFVISIFNTMRDPRYYEKPSDFIPDRHEDTSSSNPFTYIPFSAGQRNCIGQRFAMLEMKVILCKIVREYELLPFGVNVEPILGIVLRSETGMQIGLKKRTSK
ncbi:cytochrome P450 4d8-like [Musca vetustissima]|uniref:cytochrome P450 4d8-like n=1 Tax=Musca vetustissima TaxID=27455 RepID=UPI002AB6736F|nr:cytochrome P450 4d8-like [Musca vetustissima]